MKISRANSYGWVRSATFKFAPCTKQDTDAGVTGKPLNNPKRDIPKVSSTVKMCQRLHFSDKDPECTVEPDAAADEVSPLSLGAALNRFVFIPRYDSRALAAH